jgi:hypothetical protein
MNTRTLILEIFLFILISVFLTGGAFALIKIIRKINKKKQKKRSEVLQKEFSAKEKQKQFIFITEKDQLSKFITIPASDVEEAAKIIAEEYPGWKATFVQQR